MLDTDRSWFVSSGGWAPLHWQASNSRAPHAPESTPVACTGPSDAFELPPVTQCRAAGVSLLDFQLQQRLVDGALTNGAANGLLRRSSAEIMGMASRDLSLERLDLYIVDQISSSVTFRCPSGVNVDFGGVDPGIGRVRKVALQNEILVGGRGPDTFSVYERK